MRINRNTYPSYMDLEEKKYGHLKIDSMFEKMLPSVAAFNDFITSIVSVHRQVANRYYMTNPFKEAIIQAREKIMDDDKHMNDIPSDCGIIFTDKGYSLYLSNPTDKKLKLLCFGFTRDTLTTYGYVDNDGNFGGMACSLDANGKPFNDTIGLAAYLNSILLSLYFIHNCEIDTKVMQPNEKYRNQGNKYFNESKSNITILDCRWFTELIRSIPFQVRGHLRWQVHGEKRTKRKLIWIEEYKKSGYKRSAQKEIVNE